jgi:DNA-3-methyladenine glycosylase
MKLPERFYTQNDTLKVAQQLLGKVLCSNIGGEYCNGIICETEAYLGATDKASHAYGNRLTKRTKIMFARGGVAYVYLCYGIHHLFNIVTGEINDPQAILIRAIVPLEGKEQLLKRRGKDSLKAVDFVGPGKVSQALGITMEQNGLSLQENKLWIEDQGIIIDSEKIITSPRVGIDYAEEDASLPYRFQYFKLDKISLNLNN